MRRSDIVILQEAPTSDDTNDSLGQTAYCMLAPGLTGDTAFSGVFISLIKLQSMTGQELYKQIFGLGRSLYVVMDLDCGDTISLTAIEIKGSQEADSCGIRDIIEYVTGHMEEIDELTWANITEGCPENKLCVSKVGLSGNFDKLISDDWAFQEIIDEFFAQ